MYGLHNDTALQHGGYSREVGKELEIGVPCGQSVVGRAGAISRGYPRKVNLLVHRRGGSDRDGGGN
jgi:hypothetical protein